MEPQPWHVIREHARDHLSEAGDWLRSDWPSGQGPTDGEADDRNEAAIHIGRAKHALDGSHALVQPADLPDGYSLTVTSEGGSWQVRVFDRVDRVQASGRGRTLDQAVRVALDDKGGADA